MNLDDFRPAMRRRSVLATIAAGVALSMVALPASVWAQDVDTLTIIVPFPAGGTTDALARIIGEELQGTYASTVVIDNKGGAGGRIGNEAAKNAAPDGKTALLTLDLTLALYPYVFKALPYSPLTDFEPIAQVGTSAQALAVGPRVPAEVKTLDNYMAWAAANPENAFIASSGAGSGSFFASVMLSQSFNVDLEAIHYAGDAPMAAATLGGEVPATIQMLSGLIPHTADGGLRVLATGGAERSVFAPDVPTFKEAGYDVKADLQAQIYVPAGTPPELAAKLSESVLEIIGRPEIQEAFAKIGFETAPLGPMELRTALETQTKVWAEVYKASGLTPEE